jgi:hypothetical protein
MNLGVFWDGMDFWVEWMDLNVRNGCLADLVVIAHGTFILGWNRKSLVQMED